MNLANGSTDDSSDPNQTTTNGLSANLHKNGNNNNDSYNGNGLNNNRDEYKMDMKTNGSEKVAEDDPLTGRQKWEVVVGSKQALTAPRWSQRFASTNFFMVIFLLAYVLQGCYFTYFVSVITTIEKLFHIKSASIALLLNFSEIGQIATSLLLTYFAGRGHRPRWIACGMLLFSIAAFGSVSPHFLFGQRLYAQVGSVENGGQPAVGQSSQFDSVFNTSPFNNTNLCLSEESYDNLTLPNPGEVSLEFKI